MAAASLVRGSCVASCSSTCFSPSKSGSSQWVVCFTQCHASKRRLSAPAQRIYQYAQIDKLSSERELWMHASRSVESYFPEEDRDPVAQEYLVPDHLLPKVAIVGRPNVGKSALFNRLVGGDLAIVNDEPGVTRDRLYARGFWGLTEFMLVDTGGLLSVPKSGNVGVDGIAITRGGGQDALSAAVKEAHMAGLPAMIERQAAVAIEDAKTVIFVVDGQAGVTSADKDIANWLRKNHSNKKIILAVNKCESPTKGFQQAIEFWSLGFEPMGVSAISGTGTGDLLDAVCLGLESSKVEDVSSEDDTRVPSIAIIGKPNVGKSSILNALVGEERSIVSPVSGTTRDAIDSEVTGPDGQVNVSFDLQDMPASIFLPGLI